LKVMATGRPRRTCPRWPGMVPTRCAMRLARTIVTLPEELRRSLTWDQGAEMAQHARLKVDAGVQVYFCDPQSP
jgi:IS30 family transposase